MEPRADSETGDAAVATAERANAAGIGARPACFSSTLLEVLFVLTATMAVMMSSFVIGSTVVITSFIARDLDMTTAEITWITASPALASGSFLLFFGKVADTFGRKSMLVGSTFLFSVVSLGAGFSQTPITLDVLLGVMGLLSASAVPPAIGSLGASYEKPSKRKNLAFACFSAGNPLGFVFGTIFSGVATQLFSWRASFWLISIIYVIFTVIAFFTMPVDGSDKQNLSWATVKKFDVVGTLLTIGGIGMFSGALSLGGSAAGGWESPYVLVLLILGVVLMAAFVTWEMWYKTPLVPMKIWKDRDFSLLLSMLSLGFMAFPVATFWMALYMQRVWHNSALEVAVHLLPMAINGICVNIVAGFIMHKVSNKLLMAIGACAYAVSFLLFAVQRYGDSYWAFAFPAFLLVVVGADFEFTVANMYVLSALPKSQQSVAGSILQTATRMSQTVGFGISTAIFDAVVKSPSSTGYYANNPIEPYAAVFWASFAIAALGVVLTPFVRVHTQGAQKNPSRDSMDNAQEQRSGEKLEDESAIESHYKDLESKG